MSIVNWYNAGLKNATKADGNLFKAEYNNIYNELEALKRNFNSRRLPVGAIIYLNERVTPTAENPFFNLTQDDTTLYETFDGSNPDTSGWIDLVPLLRSINGGAGIYSFDSGTSIVELYPGLGLAMYENQTLSGSGNIGVLELNYNGISSGLFQISSVSENAITNTFNITLQGTMPSNVDYVRYYPFSSVNSGSAIHRTIKGMLSPTSMARVDKTDSKEDQWLGIDLLDKTVTHKHLDSGHAHELTVKDSNNIGSLLSVDTSGYSRQADTSGFVQSSTANLGAPTDLSGNELQTSEINTVRRRPAIPHIYGGEKITSTYYALPYFSIFDLVSPISPLDVGATVNSISLEYDIGNISNVKSGTNLIFTIQILENGVAKTIGTASITPSTSGSLTINLTEIVTMGVNTTIVINVSGTNTRDGDFSAVTSLISQSSALFKWGLLDNSPPTVSDITSLTNSNNDFQRSVNFNFTGQKFLVITYTTSLPKLTAIFDGFVNALPTFLQSDYEPIIMTVNSEEIYVYITETRVGDTTGTSDLTYQIRND